MIAADFFFLAERLPFASLEEVTRGGGLVVVAPHPDDESLGCGGLIAEACARGLDVRLVVVSDGIGSHPSSKLYSQAKLRDLREAETIGAMAALGLDAEAIRFLRLPDRFVPTEGPDAEAARDAIVAAAEESAASAVCVMAAQSTLRSCGDSGARGPARRPARGGPHPRLSGLGLDFAVRYRRRRAAKRPAFRHHAAPGGQGQSDRRASLADNDLIDDDPSGFRLSPEILARFARPFEIFLDVDDAVPR